MQPLNGSRLLVVEDMQETQNLLKHHLTNVGAEVVIAENGKQACQMVEQSEKENKGYDLVLMDMQMPVMDGFNATKHLRENGYRKPIIALTAHSLSCHREKCMRAGCDDFETKPIAKNLLIRLVNAWNRESKTSERTVGKKPKSLLD